MKKTVIGLIIVGIIVAGSIVLLVSRSKDYTSTSSSKSATTADKSTDESAGKKACEIISLEDAKTLIGTNAAVIEGSGDSNLATTQDVKVDNCSYSADGATLGDTKQLTLQVHAGKAASVKQSFENYKKEYPGEAVPELGADAFYSGEAKQAYVLRGNSWFFVGGGSINGGDAANRALAIQAAQIAVKKL